MPAIVVIGAQWGDEGKGRIVDLLARDARIVARYSAGNNAGHTIVNAQGEFKLHLVPAGIFYPDKLCLIGMGVAVDPKVLLDEIDSLKSKGIDVEGRLFVSDRAQVIMPYHPLIDRLDEKLRGAAAIDTTGRGVGPAFADKVGRLGIRVGELIRPAEFRERLNIVLPMKNAFLKGMYRAEPLDLEDVFKTWSEHGCRLAPYVADTMEIVQEALERGDKVLLEGAQGSLLDLDAGTYPYVTSSVPSSTAGGAATGMGIGPGDIARVVGVYKAYNTRVGNGPFPTELTDETGETLREKGWEYGTTTGRPRRCGWFDAVAARFTARLNGINAAVVTRLDVLDSFPTIKVCTGYHVDGVPVDRFPASGERLERCEPFFEEMPGWQEKTSDVRKFEDLPPAAQAYVSRLEELIGSPVQIVSVGPERGQAIIVNELL